MPTIDSLITFAAAVRADRAANPGIAGEGAGLELLIAPRFQALVESVLSGVTVAPLRVLPEYRKPGFGRPDLAFAPPGAPARAFIELKAPDKSVIPERLTGHDADQFRRFCELPLWALTNFTAIHLYERDRLIDRADVVPVAALDPAVSAAKAEALIRAQDPAGLERIVQALSMAQPPQPGDAKEVAQVLAHAARLVREVVLAQAKEGFNPVVESVRDEFNETLFARAEAGGYDARDMTGLFASAFAQTLVFGLLLAHEAGGGGEVDRDAYRRLPDDTYPLLRGTLRALTLDEVRDMLGVAFDLALDAVNSVDPGLLAPKNGRDPVLYLYEDFLRVFDPGAVAKYGVYYTPPEVVRLIVTEADHALKEGLGTEGLLDENVRLLDPACGTGTFLLGAIGAAAHEAEKTYGAGMAPAAVSDFAQRMYGFELLVGPYTVAHYRVLREVAGRGGGAKHIPIYLTDTLAPPAGEVGVAPHLDFMGAPMVAEREAADRVKRDAPILAIIGNPPYKRLKKGEVPRLVGSFVGAMWEDLKKPVRDAGFGRSLNAFPDLYVAFYRWALWRLFEAEGALGRGVVAFITNRNFLTGTGFGGLRRMLRRRFDHLRIIDFRGDNRGALPATVASDENVFNIEVGVCVLIASARGGKKAADAEARVEYADVWAQGAFTRKQKLALAEAAANGEAALDFRAVAGTGMEPLKPRGFAAQDWPGVQEVFGFRSNGIVTYRDAFAYATTAEEMEKRIKTWMGKSLVEAKKEFKDSSTNKTASAIKISFNKSYIYPVSYRPYDIRYIYTARKGMSIG
ncbi:MAG: N-6 DNA methylase [Maricaulaceae bacterium]|nr:N-6 DNA methylase [Maricaulaceae bacterium]